MTREPESEPEGPRHFRGSTDARFELLAAPLDAPTFPAPATDPPASARDVSDLDASDLDASDPFGTLDGEPGPPDSPTTEVGDALTSTAASLDAAPWWPRFDDEPAEITQPIARLLPRGTVRTPEPAPTAETATEPPIPRSAIAHVAASPQPRHRRRPWPLIGTAALLALTLGLATYLLVAARAHESRSHEWEAAARTTGAQLTQTRADLDGTVAELAATRDQLAQAQARITQLADEKAQLGDDRELQRQLADYQQRISTAAGNVATALSTCISGQVQLISYLENPAAYNQSDLARFRTDVQTQCGAATDANAALQRELKR